MPPAKTRTVSPPLDQALEEIGDDLPEEVAVPRSTRGGLIKNLAALTELKPNTWYKVWTYKSPKGAAEVYAKIVKGEQATPEGLVFDIEPRMMANPAGHGRPWSYLAAKLIVE